ncbi:MAG: tRNA guanosine(15) transglycosylase TgtA [Candidatus Bathyarchaeia archaeon]
MFELLRRDACGRLGKLQTTHGIITTPALLPVYNPNVPIISTEELETEFEVQGLMTNAYVLFRDPKLRESATEGVHRLLSFHRPIMTDSGAYQAWEYGKELELSNREIIEFEETLNPDIATTLDVFTETSSRDEAMKGVEETIRNAIECTRMRTREGILWAAPIQGGRFLDLLRQCARRLSRLDFDLHPIGTLTPSLTSYEFRDLAEMLIVARLSSNLARPLHAFGVGHPMVFSLAVGLGADLFDSAAYALYAKDLRYMTVLGTKKLDDIEEFPCFCPVCTRMSPEEVSGMERPEMVRTLARHNLYVSLGEMKTVRQAIRENRLWELIQERARAHPRILEALRYVLKRYKSRIERFDPNDKKSAFFYSGIESEMRPEVTRARRLLKRVSSDHVIYKPPFGLIPYELKNVYPFGQSIIPEGVGRGRGGREWGVGDLRGTMVSDESIVKKIVDYQFGIGASGHFDDLDVRRSRRTGRIRYVYSGGILLGTLRSNDGFLIPTIEGGKRIIRALPFPKARVVVSDEATGFIRKGGSVFAKFVIDADPDIRPRDEVLVVDGEDRLLGVGKALLNRDEMRVFSRGVAVKVRSGLTG